MPASVALTVRCREERPGMADRDRTLLISRIKTATTVKDATQNKRRIAGEELDCEDQAPPRPVAMEDTLWMSPSDTNTTHGSHANPLARARCGATSNRPFSPKTTAAITRPGGPNPWRRARNHIPRADENQNIKRSGKRP